MAAASFETAHIANHFDIPQAQVQALVSDPTTALVKHFLEALIPRIREYEELKARQLRSDVELENAVRGGEARASTLKSSNEKLSQEIEQLRLKLNEQGMRTTGQ
jgi:nucleoprotein TPR